MNANSERYDFPFSSAVRDELNGYAKRWERVVWFGGLKKMNDDVQFRGFSMEGTGYKMLTWTCAGRVLVSIYGAKDAGHLSFVADENADYPRTGLQSADGDIDAIGIAMDKIIADWRKGKRPVRDDKVSI